MKQQLNEVLEVSRWSNTESPILLGLDEVSPHDMELTTHNSRTSMKLLSIITLR